MIILVGHATTPDKLKLITSAAATIDVTASYVDVSDAAPPVVQVIGKQCTAITTATTTDILAGTTTATHRRNAKQFTIRNKHATITTDVTMVLDAIAGADYEMYKTTLLPGQTLEYIEGVGFFTLVSQAAVQSIFNVSTAAQGPGFTTDTYLTGSNLLIGGRLKVGTILRWNVKMSKTAVSTAVTATIIRFGTAGAVGDTARVTMAGPAQSAVVDEAMLEIEAVVWAHSATVGVVRGSQNAPHSAAVAAGFGEMFDAVTSGNFDTTVPNLQAGISINHSTAANTTVEQVTAEAFNLA